jgi:hypothetical protein
MIAISSASGLSRVKDGIVETIHGSVDDTNEMLFRDVLF